MAEKTYRFYIRQGEFELDLEGDRAFVEAYLEAFLESGALGQEGPGTPPAKAPGRRRAGAPRGRADGPSVDAAALAAHMKGRRPRNHKERILGYLGFLTASGVRAWGTGHLVACYAAAGVPFPAAGRQYFQILKRQGLVEKGGARGLWRLTGRGATEAEALGLPEKTKGRPKRTRRAGRRPKAKGLPGGGAARGTKRGQSARRGPKKATKVEAAQGGAA